MSTGGFSTRNESIGAWDSPYVKSVVTLFMFLGGVNFALLFKVATGHVGELWKSEVFRTYVYVVAGMMVLFVAILCSLMNAFSGLVTAYVYKQIEPVTEEQFTSIDIQE
jgi:Trk-type K+ transport system membrane component